MALIGTLAKAGLKRSKGTFLGLFFLMALTSTTLVFTICMYVDLNAREAEALAEAGAGDVYAYDLASNLTDASVAEIKALDMVGEVRTNGALTIPTKFYDSKGESVDKNPSSSVLYKAWGEGVSCRLLAADGASFVDDPQPPAAGEVYVPLPLHVSPGMELGDTVELSMGSKTRTLVIAGFIEDPQMGTSFMELKRYQVSPDTYAELARDVDAAVEVQGEPGDIYSKGSYTYRLIEMNAFLSEEARAAGGQSADLTRAIAEDTAWGAEASGMLSADTLAGYAMMVVVIGAAIMGVFACLLFVVALVICGHAISSSIEEHYADYGTLKALGVGRSALVGMLMMEYVGISVVGFAVGLAAAMALVPLALPFFAHLTGVLATNDVVPLEAFAALGVFLAFVVAVVAWQARKLGGVSPLVVFRGGAGDVSFASHAARPVTGRRLGFQLACRAIVSAKRRYVGLAACAILLSAFVVLVFGIGSTLAKPGAAYTTFGMWRSDVTVNALADDVDFDEVEKVIASVSPIKRSWEESFTMVNFSGESRSFVGLSDTSLVMGIAEGRAPLHDNEVLVGSNLAALMGLRVGDELEAPAAGGGKRTFLVCGTLSSMLNAGYGCIVTFDAVCDLAGSDPDTGAAPHQYELADSDAAAEARAALEERFGERIDARPSGLFADTGDMVELIQQLFLVMAYLMALVAVALVFLAVALIIGRLFSAERQDLGTYRALGFTCRALRVQFALRFFIVALVGCALGATVSILGGGWLVSQLFGMFGLTRFALDANPVAVAALTVGLAFVFLAAAFVSARKIKRVDVRELVAE